jgi:hypothetical protein
VVVCSCGTLALRFVHQALFGRLPFVSVVFGALRQCFEEVRRAGPSRFCDFSFEACYWSMVYTFDRLTSFWQLDDIGKMC